MQWWFLSTTKSVSTLLILFCQYFEVCSPGSGSMITSGTRRKHDRVIAESNQGTVSQTWRSAAEAIPLHCRKTDHRYRPQVVRGLRSVRALLWDWIPDWIRNDGGTGGSCTAYRVGNILVAKTDAVCCYRQRCCLCQFGDWQPCETGFQTESGMTGMG